jgi:hypothetical protein
VTSRTIQPTQVAGFNQFFDDVNGTEAWTYAGAIDVRVTRDISVGIEASQRWLQEHLIPLFNPNAHTVHEDREEQLYRGYVYWTLDPEWALSSELVYDNYKSGTSVSSSVPNKVETWSIPLSIRYFHPFGIFGVLTGSLVSQEVNRKGNAEVEGKRFEGNSNFFILDAAVGYRMPRRFGVVSIEGKNLFNTGFKYQDDSFREFRIDPVVNRFTPERTVIARVTANF